MGYDLHITRRNDWSDSGDDITADEWLAYVGRDPELKLQPENGPCFVIWSGPSETDEEAGLDWSEGCVYSKNPDEALIDKMVAIARELDAAVQGDDGEVYEGGRLPPQQSGQSLRERIAGWFRFFRPAPRIKIEHPPLPFRVGSRVRDRWGNQHTVLAIDPEAQHGLGTIHTRRDDGTEHQYAMVAHGFTPIPISGA